MIEDATCAELDLRGEIRGTRFLWTRAKFEHQSVEVNCRNKLKLEVFSRLTAPLHIESVELVTNTEEMNKVVDMRESYDDNQYHAF